MIENYNTVATILFSDALGEIKQQLKLARKDYFSPNDRIVIQQDIEDEYPYIDAPGKKLIEIQKIINGVDISNCFILLVTLNPNIKDEIDFITKFYSIDPIPINFLINEGFYNKEIKKYQDTSCQKLWNHLYVGPDFNVHPCCVADHRFPLADLKSSNVSNITHSFKFNQIRDWMTQGYRSIACDFCYANEDRNLRSFRQSCHQKHQDINLTSLDIRLNNICNFKCRMCSEYFSSAIQEETIQLYGKDAILGFEKNSLKKPLQKEISEEFNKLSPYITNNIKEIQFAGGEPLITSEHYLILDKLIEIGNFNLKINYSTNLSKLTYKNINVVDYWNQFDNVTVRASIDASHRVAEYVRHGTVWSDIVQNILYIKENAPNVKLKIFSTVSFLTIENLINLQKEWIDAKMFDVFNLSISNLTSPVYLSLAALPAHHKHRLSKIIQSHIEYLGNTFLALQWKDVLSFMNNHDFTYALDDFKHRTRVLDEHRNESFVEIFPELKDLYE